MLSHQSWKQFQKAVFSLHWINKWSNLCFVHLHGGVKFSMKPWRKSLLFEVGDTNSFFKIVELVLPDTLWVCYFIFISMFAEWHLWGHNKQWRLDSNRILTWTLRVLKNHVHKRYYVWTTLDKTLVSCRLKCSHCSKEFPISNLLFCYQTTVWNRAGNLRLYGGVLEGFQN